MEKQKLIDRTVEMLHPFETENLMKTLQTLSLKELFTNPILLCVFALLLFFGIYKKSKTILLSLFSIIGMILIIRFAVPSGTANNAEMSLGSVVPFVVGGIAIGGVIIYFTFIKSE